ncbi:MAG TPA: RNA methyltransferase [Firmicutes bacterium]|nr:RNA methyltransferase [Bacillota bacterium]
MIESLNNERVKYWAKLSDKKYQESEHKFLVEGEHLVEEAKKAGRLLEVISLNDDGVYDDVTVVSENIMRKISSLKTIPRVIGVVEYLQSREITGNVILLDRVMDPGNLGTIIRSAVAFSIDTIVLGEGCVSLYNPKVVRASEGLLFHINIVNAPLYETIEALKRENYTIYATDVNGGKELSKTNFNSKVAIMIGNEGAGVDRGLANMADEKLYIEMTDKCESLNVGVATSIILYELNKK